jgi:hypothetical protein
MNLLQSAGFIFDARFAYAPYGIDPHSQGTVESMVGCPELFSSIS